MLIASSNFTVAYWPAILITFIVGVFALRYYVRTPEGRYRWHKMKLGIPVVGKVIYKATLGRFARALAVMMKAGVPLVQGMTVISRAVDNDYISDRIVQMRDGVERGHRHVSAARDPDDLRGRGYRRGGRTHVQRGGLL
jgi:MSHA biogenesis protein MshG